MDKIYSKFINNYKYIEKYYKKLVELTKNHNFVGSTNEWIIDNFYLIVEHRNAFKRNFRNKKYFKLATSKNAEVYDILKEIFEKHNYNLDDRILVNDLNAYQNKNDYYFSYSAIRVIPLLIPIILIDRLKELCVKREEKLEDLNKVSEIIAKIDNAKNSDSKINIIDYVPIDSYLLDHPYYLYNLNSNLKEFGEASNDLFELLNKYLEENNVNLKEVITNEYKSSISDDILVSNLFRTLKNLKYEELYYKINKAEKILANDPTFKNMTLESKNFYRGQIIKNTKK